MVELIRYPTDADWYEVKRRALVTVGKTEFEPPTDEWKHKILEARHSPIRYLMFSFYIECPYFVSTHLARHIHAQPYIRSQRNDRQSDYDRNAARQDAPVQMILDLNSEELMVIANKRLCNKAAKETRELVKEMCALVEDKCPEFKGLLVPMCVYHGGVCHEMASCKDESKNKPRNERKEAQHERNADIRYVLRRFIESGEDVLTRRNLQRMCRPRFNDTEKFHRIVDILIENRYVKEEIEETGGRPSTKLVLNPNVKWVTMIR